MAKALSETMNWTIGLVVKTFGLNKVLEGFPLLDEWLTVVDNLTVGEIEQLEKRRLRLLKNVNGWNEETLKMKFISFILDMAEYDEGEFQGVFEADSRPIHHGTRVDRVGK